MRAIVSLTLSASLSRSDLPVAVVKYQGRCQGYSDGSVAVVGNCPMESGWRFRPQLLGEWIAPEAQQAGFPESPQSLGQLPVVEQACGDQGEDV